MPDAQETLQAAQEVLKLRDKEYGDPLDSFSLIADLWNAYLVFDAKVMRAIQPHDVAVMMALFKIARIKSNPTGSDSFLDLIGYAALAAQVSNSRLVGIE